MPLSDKKQKKLELIDLLEEKKRRQEDNPLKYYNCYVPRRHEKQIEAHESLKAIRVLFWGNRVGKTEWGAQEVARYLLDKHPLRDTSGKIEVWAACPSYDVQEETTQKKLLKYIPEKEIEHITYIRGKIIKVILLKNGKKLTFKSYEQGRSKFQGAGKRLIWFDEEPPSDIYEESFVRQEAGMQLDIIMTMTPVNGMTWVYDDIYMDTSNPDIFTSEAGWDDNPYLLESQKEQMSRGLSDEAIQVRRFGRFIARVGLVCSWWRREKHLREYSEFPRDWSYYEALDGGWSDPTAWLLIGIDSLGNFHVMDGFREANLEDDTIIEKRNNKTSSLLIRGGVSDCDNPRQNENLRKKGLSLLPVEKKKGENASWDEALAEKLSEYGKLRKDTGEPQLYINKDLTWLIQEIENLKWLEQKKKEGSEIEPKWDDHRRYKHHWDGIRALSYFLIQHTAPDEDSINKTVSHNKSKINKWSIH